MATLILMRNENGESLIHVEALGIEVTRKLTVRS